MRYLCLYFFCITAFGYAGEESKGDGAVEKKIQKVACAETEEFSETKGTVVINGKTIGYQSVAGNLLLRDDNCQPKASIFFISYTKEGEERLGERPITFCFNGGPGSSSVWLHIGLLGPKRIYLNDHGEELPPYHLVENEYSMLDVTDLVFIDPVSTGFSHAIPREEAKMYHGVEGDIKSVAEFIRLYLTRYYRWESPKFLIGESYGTTRAAGLAGYLHDQYYIYVNGIALISTVLNYQSIDFNVGNDLPYLLFLPSYTAAAWHHKKLGPELQGGDLFGALKASQEFMVNDYTKALFKGSALAGADRQRIVKQLSRLTGLNEEYIERSNLRIDQQRFFKELLRDQKRTVGRFDSRFLGIDADAAGELSEYDPAIEAVLGPFTSVFNHYLETALKCKKEQPYKILTAQKWDWEAVNKYLNVSDTLRGVMTKNTYLRVFVGSGYYDLAIPFYSTEYTFNHLGLDDSLMGHVTMKYYEGGHMMYTQLPVLKKMKGDLSDFYEKTLVEQERDEKAAAMGRQKA